MNDVLIEAQSVSKRFCRNLKRSLLYGVQDIASDLLGRERSATALRSSEFWANSDVSFQLKRGECLGLIGHNGAGKTTLLKMLNGLIKPDKGRIEIKGRIGALIALGAGFNPILTGRENVYIAGSVLGLSRREIAAKYDEIVEFSDLVDFMEAPVQSYSSGMQVRLGFAVASSLNPDVLLIDEVLAVGDAGFRAKCYNRVHELCRDTAVIFVSHTMPQVARLCDRVLLLDRGRVEQQGETSRVIERYHQLQDASTSEGSCQLAEGVEVSNLKICGEAREKGDSVEFRSGEDFAIEFDYEIPSEIEEVELAVSVASSFGEIIGHANSRISSGSGMKTPEKARAGIVVRSLWLGSEPKKLSVTLRDARTNSILFWGHTFIDVIPVGIPHVPAPFYMPADFTIE